MPGELKDPGDTVFTRMPSPASDSDRFFETLVSAAFGGRGPNRADLNGDGFINSLDLAQVRRLFGQRPGPSAWQ